MLQVGHAMNTVLHEANERIKFPLRKLFINMLSPSVSHRWVTCKGQDLHSLSWQASTTRAHKVLCNDSILCPKQQRWRRAHRQCLQAEKHSQHALGVQACSPAQERAASSDGHHRCREHMKMCMS